MDLSAATDRASRVLMASANACNTLLFVVVVIVLLAALLLPPAVVNVLVGGGDGVEGIGVTIGIVPMRGEDRADEMAPVIGGEALVGGKTVAVDCTGSVGVGTPTLEGNPDEAMAVSTICRTSRAV